MAPRYQVPGVYYEPKPRARRAAPDRTDVLGFVGFEPRVRDGATPSQLHGTPAVGHAFRVDVASFQLEVGRTRARVPATPDLVLSQAAASIPMASGAAQSYALLVVDLGGRLALEVVAGTASLPGQRAAAPADDTVEAELLIRLGTRHAWQRLADVEILRTGDTVRPLVRPALAPEPCDDWQDFVLAFGEPREDGTLLAHALRAFFTNGGRRAHVATVLRPRLDDAPGLAESLAAMIGVAGAPEREATGVERLLLVEEVAVLDLPDLHARRPAEPAPPLPLPPVADDACFRACASIHAGRGDARPGPGDAQEPLFDDAQLLAAQVRLVERCIPERWRVLLLLDVPLELDPADGRWKGPSAPRASAWRAQLAGLGTDEEMSVAAIYFPWLLAQERVDAPVIELPPSAFVAGVIARRDLARGAHLAPANETLRGVVGVTTAVDDETHARLYDPPANINVLRPFPGYGVQVWGARTLSPERWLRYLPVRRCLSAIERRMALALREVVFEPHDQLLWLRTAQLALDVLVPLYQQGALRGERADDAFYVRCDESVNPPESIAAGRLVCEVGVAIAAPAEFVVFRVGRAEGVLEVVE